MTYISLDAWSSRNQSTSGNTWDMGHGHVPDQALHESVTTHVPAIMGHGGTEPIPC
jgi:hypothetical protein